MIDTNLDGDAITCYWADNVDSGIGNDTDTTIKIDDSATWTDAATAMNDNLTG